MKLIDDFITDIERRAQARLEDAVFEARRKAREEAAALCEEDPSSYADQMGPAIRALLMTNRIGQKQWGDEA